MDICGEKVLMLLLVHSSEYSVWSIIHKGRLLHPDRIPIIEIKWTPAHIPHSPLFSSRLLYHLLCNVVFWCRAVRIVYYHIIWC